MEKQTAVEWVFEQISSSKYFYYLMEDINGRNTVSQSDILDRAKEMEKEQQGYNEEDMRESYFTAIKSTSEGLNGEYAGGNHPNIEKTFKEGFEIFIEQFKKK